MFVVDFADQALDDLDDIYFNLTQYLQDAQHANRLVDDIKKACIELADSPFMRGVARPELMANLRSKPFKVYVLFYKYERNTLKIIRILAGKRDIKSQNF